MKVRSEERVTITIGNREWGVFCPAGWEGEVDVEVRLRPKKERGA